MPFQSRSPIARPQPRLKTLPALAWATLAALPSGMSRAESLYPGCEGALGTAFAGGYAAARKQVTKGLEGLEKELQGTSAARDEAIRARLRELAPQVARLAPQALDPSSEGQCRAAGVLHGAQFSLAEAKRAQPRLCASAGARFGTSGASLLCTLQRGRASFEAVHPQSGWATAGCEASFRGECEAAFKARFSQDCGGEAIAADDARVSAHAQAFCQAIK